MALRPLWAAPNAILPYTPASLPSLSQPCSSGCYGPCKNVLVRLIKGGETTSWSLGDSRPYLILTENPTPCIPHTPPGRACHPRPVISIITIATHIVLSWGWDNGGQGQGGRVVEGRGTRGEVRGAKRAWAWAMARVRVRVRRAAWAWDVGVVKGGEGGEGRNEGGVVGMDMADGEGKEGEGGVDDDQVEGRGMRARWGRGGGRAPRRPSVMWVGHMDASTPMPPPCPHPTWGEGGVGAWGWTRPTEGQCHVSGAHGCVHPHTALIPRGARAAWGWTHPCAPPA